MPTDGVVPISASQDAPGPLAPTVGQAAALLTVLAGGGVDYAAHAVAGRLAGKRIGVPRATYWGYSPHADAAAERAVSLLAAAGRRPSSTTSTSARRDLGLEDELLVHAGRVPGRARATTSPPRRATCRAAWPRWSTSTCATPRSSWPTSGSRCFERALAAPGVASPEYAAARARCVAASRGDGIDARAARPTTWTRWSPRPTPRAVPIDLGQRRGLPRLVHRPAAMAGYPLLTVPTELAAGLPVAVSFWGTAGSEATLVEIGHGYELARDPATGRLPEPTYADFV